MKVVARSAHVMQRLAVLVLRHCLHLARFHGCSRLIPSRVLAPNAKLRAVIVLSAYSTSDHAPERTLGAPARMSCARLFDRVFDIDIERCPNLESA